MLKPPKYNIIYADPPWQYSVRRQKGMRGTAENHYSTMSMEDIKRLPVQDIAAKDCALFLWVTFPCLKEAFDVIAAWGFTYKTCAFTWVKKNKKADSYFMGLGHWTWANAEICLLATKGNIKRLSRSVPQICDARIRKHSQKPDDVRDRIVALIGDLPRIELFARNYTPGWDVWGNEVESSIDVFDIKFVRKI